MRKRKIFIILLFLITSVYFTMADVINYSQKHKDILGYYIDGQNVTFVYTPDIRRWKKPQTVFVAGSFNGWSIIPQWQLQKEATSNRWTMTKSYKEVHVPGNSGLPEFKFVVDGQKWEGPLDKHPKGYSYLYHFVVLLGDVSPRDVIKREKKSKILITKYKTDEDLSNFRETTFGNMAPHTLYRSYNPFIPSRPRHPREKDRLAMVQKLMQKNGIKSVINLSDTPKDLSKRSVPKYYNNLIERNNVLFVDTGYNIVYYGVGTNEFNELFKNIFNFIIEKESPFLVHCRLGTDRTGVVIAVLEALMGATPLQITLDYERSNNMGLEEYRDKALIEYTISKMLGESIYKVEDIAGAIKYYFINKAGFDESLINKVQKKLANK